MDLLKQINFSNIPQHIAVIMDGNGRWAQQQGHERLYGHNYGVESVREVLKAAKELKVKYLTLYAFSTENWNRPKAEIDALMSLLVSTINKETKTLNENNIRLQAIGDLKSLPKNCYRELMEAIEKTSQNKRMTLVLALSYSSKWEIVNAAKKIAEKIQKKEISAEEIDENLFENELCTVGLPEPELMIRTSGEHRISNYLLWQLAYAELYFTEKLWPDFRREDLFEAIVDFQKRERRFGKISEQLIAQ